MRKALVSSVIGWLVLAVAAPALAQPAQFIFRDSEGRLRMARVGDVAQLREDCGTAAPAGIRGSVPMVLISGDRRQGVVAYTTSVPDEIYLEAVEGPILDDGTWCLADEDLTDALLEAERLPSNSGPWIGFVAAIGGLGIAVALIAAWGGGIGPRPGIGSAPDEEHPGDAASGEHADTGEDTPPEGHQIPQDQPTEEPSGGPEGSSEEDATH